MAVVKKIRKVCTLLYFLFMLGLLQTVEALELEPTRKIEKIPLNTARSLRILQEIHTDLHHFLNQRQLRTLEDYTTCKTEHASDTSLDKVSSCLQLLFGGTTTQTQTATDPVQQRQQLNQLASLNTFGNGQQGYSQYQGQQQPLQQGQQQLQSLYQGQTQGQNQYQQYYPQQGQNWLYQQGQNPYNYDPYYTAQQNSQDYFGSYPSENYYGGGQYQNSNPYFQQQGQQSTYLTQLMNRFGIGQRQQTGTALGTGTGYATKRSELVGASGVYLQSTKPFIL